jgi:hypothetical protein
MLTSNEERILKIEDTDITEKDRLGINPKISPCLFPKCYMRIVCLIYKKTEFDPVYPYPGSNEPNIKDLCFIPDEFPIGFNVDEVDEEVYEYYLDKIIDSYDYR